MPAYETEKAREKLFFPGKLVSEICAATIVGVSLLALVRCSPPTDESLNGTGDKEQIEMSVLGAVNDYRSSIWRCLQTPEPYEFAILNESSHNADGDYDRKRHKLTPEQQSDLLFIFEELDMQAHRAIERERPPSRAAQVVSDSIDARHNARNSKMANDALVPIENEKPASKVRNALWTYELAAQDCFASPAESTAEALDRASQKATSEYLLAYSYLTSEQRLGLGALFSVLHERARDALSTLPASSDVIPLMTRINRRDSLGLELNSHGEDGVRTMFRDLAHDADNTVSPEVLDKFTDQSEDPTN